MKTFDPAAISPYSVIRIPFRLGDESHILKKRFVVLGHLGGYAICLKATSQVKIYINNRELMVGCVYYKAGELKAFSKDTVIQPDNQIPIAHDYLIQSERNKSLDILGIMPADFRSKLKKAISDSLTMSEREKLRLLKILGK